MARRQLPADDLRRTALKVLEARLPPGWSVESVLVHEAEEHDLVFRDGRGTERSVLVEANSRPSPRELRALTGGVSKRLRKQGGDVPIMVVVPYIGPRDRELLQREGISYLDLTGNVRIVLDSPGLFIQADGARRDPRSSKASSTLRG